MKNRDIIVVAWSPKEQNDKIADRDVWDILECPSPPKHYGTAASEKWHIEKGPAAREAILRELPTYKLTGDIGEIVAIAASAKKKNVFDSSSLKKGVSPAEGFLSWVTSGLGYTWPTAIQLTSPTETTPGESTPCLVGFNIKQFVRICGMQATLYGKHRVPLGFWYNNQTILDPYDMCVEVDLRKQLDIRGFCAVLGKEQPTTLAEVANLLLELTSILNFTG